MSSVVYVHVGTPKSGTTFLQQVLWSQRALAAEQGVVLPLEHFNNHYWATLDVRGLAGKEPHPTEAMGAWDRLSSAALADPAPRALISHELFAGASDTQARRAMERFGAAEVHLVVTARDLVRQVTAEWQEHVKHRSTSTLSEFVANLRERAEDRSGWFWRVQDVAGIIDRWGKSVPAERIHIVTLPPSGGPPGLLWERFARLLGLEPGSFDTTSQRQNTSLGLAQTELLRQVNLALGDRLPVPGPYPGVAKDVLAHKILAAQAGLPLQLDDHDVAYAVATSQLMVAELSELDVDIVGSLGELISVAPTDTEARAEVTTDQLADSAIAAIADLLAVMSEREKAGRETKALVTDLKSHPFRTAVSQAADTRPSLQKAKSTWGKFTGR
ncbi:MAG: hypothetical protein HZY75_14210 [Nocardioidaceae bacterium]|nr:MAG: hypothetical protein HZY75_14210 [Nocardioidaceae bacterium]